MCNCGNKRQALNASNALEKKQNVNNNIVKPISATAIPDGLVKIRYTGNSYLNIRSTISRHVYSFSTANRQLIIRAEDMPILSRFRELVQVN
jgi:hypothetical protein